MTTQKPRRRYTEEFKREAVSLVTEQGYRASQAAKSLGIRDQLIYKWKAKFEGPGASGSKLTTDEQAELKRLRQENLELRMEKEILKKASAYFAREMS